VNNTDAKKNLSTEQSPAGEETRLSRPDGDEKRTSSLGASSSERPQTLDSASLLETIIETSPDLAVNKLDLSFPKAYRLRKPAEFKLVYTSGKRFERRFISAFVRPNNLQNHRLGITASRKTVGNAVQRNRAKRLLREVFRLSKIELNCLENKYDFVFNARRSLLAVKVNEPLADFQELISKIAANENQATKQISGEQKQLDVNLTDK
jgi:ribonuclease P protein component